MIWKCWLWSPGDVHMVIFSSRFWFMAITWWTWLSKPFFGVSHSFQTQPNPLNEKMTDQIYYTHGELIYWCLQFCYRGIYIYIYTYLYMYIYIYHQMGSIYSPRYCNVYITWIYCRPCIYSSHPGVDWIWSLQNPHDTMRMSLEIPPHMYIYIYTYVSPIV